MSAKIPRSRENDYTDEIIAERQRFLEEKSGTTLQHTKHYSFDPESMEGNCEQLFGVAQLPIGVAGPLLVNGEHAQGEFYVPMATIEGTLVVNVWLWLGLICYGISVIVWILALSRVDVSIAYPMLSIGYVVNAIAAWHLFDEPMSLGRMIGIGIIILGVFVLARS